MSVARDPDRVGRPATTGRTGVDDADDLAVGVEDGRAGVPRGDGRRELVGGPPRAAGLVDEPRVDAPPHGGRHDPIGGEHTELAVRLAEPHRGPSGYAPVGAVVGGTDPEALSRLRALLPYSVLLVPGYGAQGAEAEDVAGAFDADGLGAVVNSSRALTYLSEEADFAAGSRAAVEAMRGELNGVLGL